MAYGIAFLRFRNWPDWLQVVAVWAATRVVAALGFAYMASIQGATPWQSTGHPEYFDFLDTWDAEWYRRIFQHGIGHDPGYPVEIPTNLDGSVRQNAWAFMPGFPLLVRLFSLLFGNALEWKYLAPAVSLVLSFVLALLMHRLFLVRVEHRVALWAVALFGLWCASPVLQTAYGESLGLVLLVLALLAVVREKYLAALPWLALLSITRPGEIAFVLVYVGIWLHRWLEERNGGRPFHALDRLKLASAAAASGIFGIAWPIFAWMVTGRADAYEKTELAWRTANPDAHLVVFEGWYRLGVGYVGDFWAPMFVIASVVLAVWLIFRPSMRAVAPELSLWTGSYLLYLIAVFNPQSSTWRILLMAFPLIGGFAYFSRDWSRFARVVLVVALIAAQLYWLSVCWLFASPDFTPP